jgi:Ca-activated chloride channel homolog
MNDEDKLTHARDGLQLFLRQFSSRDRVGLIGFSERPYALVPIEEVALDHSALRAAVANLAAGGGTAVYDATAAAVEAVAALHDSSRINAVVVLTDGEDNRSTRSVASLETELKQRAEDQERNIRVFTIAYGADANKDVLTEIAAAAGGEAFKGDPKEIAEVYRQISSFF